MLTKLDTNLYQGPPCHQGAIRGLGSLQSGVVVIGVAPGKDEVRTGKPLTGATGKIFDTLLNALGTPRNTLYVTNMSCVHIKDKIKREHLEPCWPRLKAELHAIAPKLIIVLGAEPCQYWTGKPVTKARGAVLWNEEFSCYVMPMIQPAALFHDGSTGNTGTDRMSNAAYDIVRDLRKIDTILRLPRDGSYSEVKYSIVESTEEAQRVLDSLPTDGTPVALDVETNSSMFDLIDIKKDELICLAVSDGKHSWVMPQEIIRDTKRSKSLVNWPTKVHWTFHNAVFDTAIMKRDLDIWLPVREDTMLRSYVCDERPGYHGLKPLAREFEAAGFWETERIKGDRNTLYGYNAKDAAYTARLASKLEVWSEAEGTDQVYANLLIPAVNVFKEIQYRGARVDNPLLTKLETMWGDERDAEHERMQDLAFDVGWPDHLLNLNSPKQLSKLLYGVIGLEGGPSTAKNVLDTLAGQHPFVDALIEYRHLEHNYKIYVNGFTKHIRIPEPYHARVHPTVKLHGTATGRLSYSDPAVQTIPRPSNYAQKYGLLRNAFIPTSDDYEIAYADYQRAEIWTAYGYSRDLNIYEALKKDYHLETAVAAMGISRERMLNDANYREEQRRIAKIVTFGIMYGIEAYGLSRSINNTPEVAQAYIDGWFRHNAGYAAWYQDTLRTLQQTGEVTSLTGRKRRFILLQDNPRALKQAVNFPIQSTASDVTLSALIKLHEMLKPYDTHILFAVHDAIVFEVHKAWRHITIPMIMNVMQAPQFDGIDFPGIPADFKIGRSWGEAHQIYDFSEDALRWVA
jgi:uracil-DNA glycosylase family 4